MNFPAIWRPKLQKFSLWCPPTSWGYLTEQTVKKLNLWRKTAADKSPWIKTWNLPSG